jgi:hypothetical protein
MSAITATHMKYASLGRNMSPRCINSRNNVLATTTRKTLAQRRRWWTSDSAFVHLCNLSGLFGFGHFNTNEHEAK